MAKENIHTWSEELNKTDDIKSEERTVFFDLDNNPHIHKSDALIANRIIREVQAKFNLRSFISDLMNRFIDKRDRYKGIQEVSAYRFINGITSQELQKLSDLKKIYEEAKK